MIYRIYSSFALAAVLGIVIPTISVGQSTSESSSALDTVSGTIEKLDLPNGKGLLRTSLGKPIFFEITKPELFKGITIGQRLTIQLDQQGRAIKAMEFSAPPELPAQAP